MIKGKKNASDEYIGKCILIGLTFIDANGNLIEQYQTDGIIKQIDNNGLMHIIKDDGNIFILPFDVSAIKTASPGVYNSRSTGKAIENPDLLTSWTIENTDRSNIEECKKSGFSGFVNNN